MQAPETELKFVVHDIPGFHASIQKLGLTLKTPRTFEGNTLFDTPDRQLRAKRQILRLREYGPHFVVTHKRLTDPNAVDTRYKTRIETETDVEDGPAMAEIFCQLGFCPAFRYEKFRTEWDAPTGGHLVLDETAIGTWAELEGDPAWIESMLAQLNIPSADCTVESYGALFLNWKQRTGSPAENLSFEEIGRSAVGASR
jgi:adenylate cyclase, class 2